MGGGKESLMKPGPGEHDVDKSKVQKEAPKFRFGTGLRTSGSTQALKTPGPGNYMAKTFTGFEKPMYSMGQTLDFEPRRKEQKHKPGPGSYSPEHRQSKKKEAAWKIGTAKRRNF